MGHWLPPGSVHDNDASSEWNSGDTCIPPPPKTCWRASPRKRPLHSPYITEQHLHMEVWPWTNCVRYCNLADRRGEGT